jgi:hypothetical protein
MLGHINASYHGLIVFHPRRARGKRAWHVLQVAAQTGRVREDPGEIQRQSFRRSRTVRGHGGIDTRAPPGAIRHSDVPPKCPDRVRGDMAFSSRSVRCQCRPSRLDGARGPRSDGVRRAQAPGIPRRILETRRTKVDAHRASARGRGVATLMLRHILDDARARIVERIYV